jgi:hypothetical protein
LQSFKHVIVIITTSPVGTGPGMLMPVSSTSASNALVSPKNRRRPLMKGSP